MLSSLCVLMLIVSTSGPDFTVQEFDKDFYGNSLPSGSFARLGDLRFRLPSPAQGLRFFGKDSALLAWTGNRPLLQRVSGFFYTIDVATGAQLARKQAVLNPTNRFGEPALDDRLLKEQILPAIWCVSNDAKYFATLKDIAHPECTSFKVFDMKTDEALLEEVYPEGRFSSMIFSQDSKTFAVTVKKTYQTGRPITSAPVKIRIWDVGSWREREPLLIPLSHNSADQILLTFSPDGTMLAATFVEGKEISAVRLWRLDQPKNSYQLTSAGGIPRFGGDIVFTPDSKGIIGQAMGHIRRFDSQTGKEERILINDARACDFLELSPDGTKLIAASIASSISLWDIATGKQIVLPVDRPFGYSWSADGSALMMEDADGKLYVCDGQTAAVRRVIDVGARTFRQGDFYYNSRQGIGRSFAVSADGKLLALTSDGLIIRFWNTVTGKEINGPKDGLGVCQALVALSTTRLLVMESNSIVSHDVGPEKGTARLAESDQGMPRLLNGHEKAPNCCALPTAGRSAAIGMLDGTIGVWNTTTGKLSWKAKADEPILACEFSGEDGTLVAIDGNGKVTWYNPSTGKAKKTLRLPLSAAQDALPCVFLSNDAKFALVWNPPVKTLQQISLSTGKMVRERKLDFDSILFTLSGGCVVGVRNNGFALIDWESGRTLRTFDLQQNKALSQSTCRGGITIDGRVFVVLVDSDLLRCWDVASGKVLCDFKGHDGGIKEFVVGQDGHTVATCTAKGTVLLWKIPNH